MPSARLIGVGTFVLGGFLLFALGIFMIGDRRLLFANQFDVYGEFEQVAGLQDGAPVRVNGMDAGEVTDMTIPASPAGRFRVRMRVRNNLRPARAHRLGRLDSHRRARRQPVCAHPSGIRKGANRSPTAARLPAASRSTLLTCSSRARGPRQRQRDHHGAPLSYE